MQWVLNSANIFTARSLFWQCLIICNYFCSFLYAFMIYIYIYIYILCKSRKSRNTWSNRQIWPWNTQWSRAKTNRVTCTNYYSFVFSLYLPHLSKFWPFIINMHFMKIHLVVYFWVHFCMLYFSKTFYLIHFPPPLGFI